MIARSCRPGAFAGMTRPHGATRARTLPAALVALAGLAGASAVAASGAAAQAGAPFEGGAPFDTTGLAGGPHARACMLLERTIFQVDVLTVDLRLGPEPADRIRALVSTGAPRDSVAAAAIRSRDAWIRIEFVRDIGMDRFLDGVRTDLRRTVGAGLIDRSTF